MNLLGYLIVTVFVLGMFALMFACLAILIETLNDTGIGRAIMRRFKRGD